ncbi:MAG: tRNA lysidine(34) synthetase TilS [Desulfotomaculaceae bacterium]|nr:tRNA lysidine(34) synthetase TilS [Desulfotomaculaceae bacterium]
MSHFEDIQKDLLATVRSFMVRFPMVEPGSKVVVAVSGGSDSVALLHLLQLLKDDLGLSLHVAHLNHMLRGEESEQDAAFVAELAGRYGLPFTVEAVDVHAYRHEKKLSTELAAREVRYRFLSDTARLAGASRVALAHHGDDQAETILINFLRGAGIAGLKGIPPVREGFYIRPLLCLRKAELERYCEAAGLSFRRDSSNLQQVYARNRIRLSLIPMLEKEYNPRLVPALLRTGELCREENEYLEEQARFAFEGALKGAAAGRVELELAALEVMPLVLRRRVLRLAWGAIVGADKNISFYHTAGVVDLIDRGESGSQISLPGMVSVVRLPPYLVFLREQETKKIPEYIYQLQIPGPTRIPELDRLVWTDFVSRTTLPDPRLLPSEEVYLDFDKLPPKLFVRRRLNGDVFHPFGLSSEVKLKDFLIKQKIPLAMRDQLPLISTPKEIVWVAGLRLGERWKVDETTRRVLHLKVVHNNIL